MLDHYLTEKAIVRKLSDLRAKAASVEHEKLRLDAISSEDRYRQLSQQALALQQLLPPRTDWIRPQMRQGMTGQQKTSRSVYAAAMKALHLPEYAKEYHTLNLQEFMAKVRERAVAREPFVFQPSSTIAIPKERGGSVYRAISRLGLADSVVDRITARYLRDCFDLDFLDCSLAFRTGKRGCPVPTHHDGFRAIMEFLFAHHDGELWVGEYDIIKFFDSIGHDVAKAAIDRAVTRAETRGVVVDPRAIQITRAFIDAYSFPKNVLQDILPALRQRDPAATFAWPGDDGNLDAFYTNPVEAKIGILQGAALSCLVANLVLHDADQAVVRSMGEITYVYLRYVDDMVLVCTSKEDCQRGMDAYRQAVKDQKLPVHEPKPDIPYGPEFWRQKSKGPYQWSDQPGCVPWVGFCGYQAHFDGHVRIRPSSIRKQIEKMRDETAKVTHRMSAAGASGIRLSRQSILHRFNQRLIARLVGHRTPDSRPGELSPNCVASGFRLLAEYPHQQGQLRVLDRARNQCVGEVGKALKSVRAADLPPRPSHRRRKLRVKYFGKPYSLAGQYQEGLSLRRGPAKSR